jgi:methyl-accepting chemotaxis protein
MKNLLNSLMLWQKFLLLGALGALMCSVPLFLLLQSETRQIETTRLELSGMTPVQDLTSLIRLLQQHRGAMALSLNGNGEGAKVAAAKQAEIKAVLPKLALHVASVHEKEIDEHWTAVDKQWKDIMENAGAGKLTPAASFQVHTNMLQDARDLLEHFADHYGLTLDPEADGYFLQSAAVVDAMNLIEELETLRGKAVDTLARHEINDESRVALAGMMNSARQSRHHLTSQVEKAEAASPDLKAKLDPVIAASTGEADNLIKFVDTQLVKGAGLSLEPAEFFRLSSEAIDAQYKLVSELHTAISMTMDERLESQSRQRLTVGAIVVGTALLALLVTLLVVPTVTRPINEALLAAQAVGDGQLDYPIRGIKGRSEAARLLQAIMQMQVNLRERNAREAQVAAEAMRVKQALDTCSTNVMIADADSNIIYLNRSVAQMMTLREQQLRQALPGFDASRLMGQSFDNFHRNPAHQRSLLGSLKGEHKVQIKVADLHFSLIANPIHDAAGLRIGTVVEWRDRTAEVAAEAEIAGVVEGATQGDFATRLNAEGKEPFFASLSGMFNGLLDTFGKTIVEVRAAAEQLTSASGQVSATSQALSQSASEQAASLEQTTASLQEMASSVKQNSDNAAITDGMAAKAAREASEGGDAVGRTVEAMKSIATKISIIDDIAYQTNLLALNAAIEAARAGEHGKGFAVVAAEVRKLAERSQVAAQEIGELATTSVGLAEKAGHLLNEMVPSINKTSELVQEIAAASSEQSGGVTQITAAMNHLNSSTQQNASSSEELSATAEQLSAQATQLQELMAFFRVADDAPAGRRAATRSHHARASAARQAKPAAGVRAAAGASCPVSRPRQVETLHDAIDDASFAPF